MSGARLSDGERERIGELCRLELHRARDFVHRTRVRNVEDDLRERARRDLGVREHVLNRLPEERRVRLRQREALLPAVREALAGGAPGVEVLARD